MSSAVQACISSCPVTAEYNPVCGTDIIQYPNPGRLGCAQACGVNVSLLRQGPCPATTTAAPPS
ncbi:serine protease inhibitor Kazal-type 2-like [Ostrinia furnacalis]|nr:serine protease inhibitor Kazal-type 2-like [Ostrinia furnacalis]